MVPWSDPCNSNDVISTHPLLDTAWIFLGRGYVILNRRKIMQSKFLCQDETNKNIFLQKRVEKIIWIFKDYFCYFNQKSIQKKEFV